MDYLAQIITHAEGISGRTDHKWRVQFSDGETRTGLIEHIGGDAFLLSGNKEYYFSSKQVVRVSIAD